MLPASITLPPALLDKLGEGFITLDAKGRPQSVTQAARPWLRPAIEKSAELASLIQASKAGKLQLPVQVNLSSATTDGPDDSPDAWLFPNEANRYALLIRRNPTRSTQTDVGPFLELIGHGLSKAFALIAKALRHEERAPADPLLERVSGFESLLRQIAGLAALHDPQSGQFEERIVLTSVLQDIIDDLHTAAGPRLDLERGSDMVPGVVYGSTYWIVNTLDALVRQLRRSCPPLARVRLLLQQVGDFIVVNGLVDSGTPVPPIGGLPAGAGSPAAHGLQLPFSEYIVATHGGTLRLRDMPTEDPGALRGENLESFTLTLPTGVSADNRNPRDCPRCRVHVLQLRQYAVDLASLLALQPEITP